jgi:hypothetical protein
MADKGGSLQDVGNFLIPDTMLKMQALERGALANQKAKSEQSGLSHFAGGPDPFGRTPGMIYNPDAPPTDTYQAQDADGNWQRLSLLGGNPDDAGISSLFKPRKVADQSLMTPMMGKAPTTDDGTPLFPPNKMQAVALQTPSLFGDTTPAAPSLFNDLPTPKQGQSDYADKQAMYLRQAAPDAFLDSAVQQAIMQDKLKSLSALGSGTGAGASSTFTPDQVRAMILDPKNALAANSKLAFQGPPDQLRLLNGLIAQRDKMDPNDPNRQIVDDAIAKARGLVTDPNKIAETKASIAEKSAQTGLANTRNDLLTSSGLDDNTLERIYQTYATTGDLAKSIGPMPRGANAQSVLTNVQNYITKRMNSDNLSPAQIAANKVNLAAQAAAQQTAAKRGANVDMVAIELDTFSDQALDAAKDLTNANANFVPWNKLKNMTLDQISDPTLATYYTAMQGARTAYASSMSRTGQTTVEAMHSADKILDSAKGFASVAATLAQMKKEAAGIKASSNAVQNNIQSRITGGAEPDVQRQGTNAQRSSASPVVAEGTTATNKQTGEKLIFRSGQWVPVQ